MVVVLPAGEPDYVQVVALIHDIGKIMFLWGAEEDGQVRGWAGARVEC